MWRMASCAPARDFGKKRRNTEATETTRRWPAAPLLVVRYGLEPLIERAYNELTCELRPRPIADRSVAIIRAGGGDALSQPVKARQP